MSAAPAEAVVHVVLFRPKPDLAEDARRGLIAAIQSAQREIPSIRRFRVGHLLADGPAYAQTGPTLPYAALVEFADRAGLEAYLSHPAHAGLGALFRETLDAAIVYDYVLCDAAEGNRLLDLRG